MKLGDIYEVEVACSWFSRFINYFGARILVDWKVDHTFLVADTRPLIEKHITLGNTRYYVLRQKNLRIEFLTTGRKMTIIFLKKWLSTFGLPARDLVLNEDHFRTARSGSVLGNFSKSLKGRLESTLSVPIKDPQFTHLGCSAVRDGLFVVQTFLAELRTPLCYEDF